MSSSPPSLPAGPPRLGTLVALAWPVVLARSTQAVMGFFDAVMVAPLGKDSLAAATTGGMNAFSIAILPMGLVFIVQSFAAQLAGKQDLVGARRYAWYGLIISAITALIGFASLPLIGPALGLLPFEPEVHSLMTDYLVLRLISLGAMVGMEALGNWYGGLGNTRLQMNASIVAMVVDLALNFILIYGYLGFPAMGVSGAALGSSIGTFVGFGVMLLVFWRDRGLPRPTGRLGLRRSEFMRVIRFGLPNGLNWFLEFAAFLLFINVVMADLGTTVLAAFMVVMSINSVSFMPAFGVSSSGAILAGQAIGAGRKDEVPRIWWLTAKTTASWMCLVGLSYLVFPDFLIAAFTPPDKDASELMAVGAVLLPMSAAWQLFDALCMTLSETLRAAGDTSWTLWARIILAWFFFVPVSLLTVYVLDGGYVGAMLCVAGYIALLAALLFWRFRSGRWRQIDLTGTEQALLIED